jgi:hypothetical protein
VKLEEAMRLKGITAKELSIAIGSGTSCIYRWVSEQSVPSYVVQFQIEKFLGLEGKIEYSNRNYRNTTTAKKTLEKWMDKNKPADPPPVTKQISIIDPANGSRAYKLTLMIEISTTGQVTVTRKEEP